MFILILQRHFCNYLGLFGVGIPQLLLKNCVLSSNVLEYDYIQSYIGYYCSEADRKCKEIDMKKTVDEVINSMKNEDFDRFTRAVIDSVHKKQGYDGQAPTQTV